MHISEADITWVYIHVQCFLNTSWRCLPCALNNITCLNTTACSPGFCVHKMQSLLPTTILWSIGTLPLVITSDVSPAGNHSVRIVASNDAEDTVSYIISDTADPTGKYISTNQDTHNYVAVYLTVALQTCTTVYSHGILHPSSQLQLVFLHWECTWSMTHLE